MTFLELGPGRDFVLLAMPKTASTSLERTLAPYATEVVASPPGQKHLPARGFVHTRAPRLAEQGRPDIMVVVGGVIPPADVPTLLEMGAAAVFPPGTVIADSALNLLEQLSAKLGH